MEITGKRAYAIQLNLSLNQDEAETLMYLVQNAQHADEAPTTTALREQISNALHNLNVRTT